MKYNGVVDQWNVVRSRECPVEEDDCVWDNDLWTVITSCIKVQQIRSSNTKPILLVTQAPDMWQYAYIMSHKFRYIGDICYLKKYVNK
jgi:hypothetical protein